MRRKLFVRCTSRGRFLIWNSYAMIPMRRRGEGEVILIRCEDRAKAKT